MSFSIQPRAGSWILDVFTPTSEFPLPPVPVGTVDVGPNGSEWVFCRANTALSAGFVAQIGITFAADHVTTANSLFNRPLGVPAVAIPANSFGWLQRKGPSSVRGLASAVADARLNTTATAGAIDDDGTVGAKVVNGITFTTAVGGVAANQAAMLNDPVVGVTL
jgi:hypothetical protein